jgi:hypothetical protein
MLTSEQLKNRATGAYACFLAPGTAAIFSTTAPLLSPRFLEPAYLGFFVLIPLVLLSALTVPVAMFFTYQIGRSEPALVALSLATPALLTAALTEVGDGTVMNVAMALYGFASVSAICYWFAVKRRRNP